MEFYIPNRPRRLRQSEAVRLLVEETHLTPAHLIAPLFITEGHNIQEPISSMPSVFRYSINKALEEIELLTSNGIRAINIFCHIAQHKKDSFATEATKKDSLLTRAIATIKSTFPEVLIFADIALDPFTDHGHDGIVNDRGDILNDVTLKVLGEMSLRSAEAGCDFLSPSDMMDGRVKYLRTLLDSHDYSHIGIMSYAAKYASSLYSPFRDALESAPKFGDKKSYQLNIANAREALKECALDEQEGADMLLIKPALTNLDIIARLRPLTNLPIGAYHVSGEWAMLHSAHQMGWLNFDRVFLETLLVIRRAGADFIITYGANRAAKILQEKLN